MDEMNEGRKAPEQPKRPNPFVRFLAFLVTVTLVLGAVALVANYDKLNFDALKRWISYRSLARSESGQAESFPFDGDISNAFAVLDGDLLVCSPNSIRLYSGSGQAYVDKTVSMEHPVVTMAGSSALVCDVGGQSLRLYSGREETFSLELPEGATLLSADLNQSGWMAVVSQESGAKGVVTIYDSAHAPWAEIRLSTRFVMDAVLSPDSKSVALLTVGLADGTFESRIDLYRLDRPSEDQSPEWTCPVGGGTILDLRWDGDHIWALGESGLWLVGSDGELVGSYNYTGKYLKAFSLEGDGTAALLLGRYRAGSSAELVVVDSSAQVRSSLALEDQVLSLSAAGRYIAVLTADQLDIYDQDLELYSELDGTQSAQKVLQRTDGSAMLINSTTAHLYIPQ